MRILARKNTTKRLDQVLKCSFNRQIEKQRRNNKSHLVDENSIEDNSQLTASVHILSSTALGGDIKRQ